MTFLLRPLVVVVCLTPSAAEGYVTVRSDHGSHHVEQREMLRMTQRLIAEYAGAAAAASVIEAAARCRERLMADGIQRGLVPATEAAVRCTLAAKLRVHAS